MDASVSCCLIHIVQCFSFLATLFILQNDVVAGIIESAISSLLSTMHEEDSETTTSSNLSQYEDRDVTGATPPPANERLTTHREKDLTDKAGGSPQSSCKLRM